VHADVAHLDSEEITYLRFQFVNEDRLPLRVKLSHAPDIRRAQAVSDELNQPHLLKRGRIAIYDGLGICKGGIQGASSRKLARGDELHQVGKTKKRPNPHYRHCFPAGLIRHAGRLYHVFILNVRDVELLLAESGILVLYESIRRWCLKFGAGLAGSFGAEGRVWAASNTWTRCSSASKANCTISGTPSIRTGSCSISWYKATAMRLLQSASSSGC